MAMLQLTVAMLVILDRVCLFLSFFQLHYKNSCQAVWLCGLNMHRREMEVEGGEQMNAIR